MGDGFTDLGAGEAVQIGRGQFNTQRNAVYKLTDARGFGLNGRCPFQIRFHRLGAVHEQLHRTILSQV